jgi:tetratricopeptide (TPR) repeat protein/tRNA A-37 threonylcarbamoyl transferase component Bud32
MPFVPGENVGPYRIMERLGQGGMATVFKAYHANLDRHVAIKVLHPAFKEDPSFLARFQREARIVANLDHPNIVPVYDFSEHEGASYLVMRYVEGKTLKEHLQGPMPMEEALNVLRPVCEALAYAHGQDVLHRDIKPSNIILTDEGQVFLADFGLARIAQSGESSLTKDMMVGTPQYISPEQAKGVSDLDARTDIYSLTVVLFEMLTGRAPFSADTPYAIIHDHIFSPLPLPRSINPNIPPQVEQVLLKGLAKERDDRFASVKEMLEAIERAVKQADTVATPPQPTVAVPMEEEPEVEEAPAEEKVSFLQRYRWLLIGGAAVLLLLCCLLASFSLRRAAQKAAEEKATPATPALVQPETPALLVQPKTPALVQPGETPAPATPPPLSDSGEEAKAHLIKGDELREAGLMEEALQEYEQAAELDPQLVEAYVRAGELLMYDTERDLLGAALGVFERGLEANPDDLLLHIKAGEALAFMGAWPEAAEYFQRAIDLEPQFAVSHAGLAYCLFGMEDIDGAREEMLQAMRLDPSVPETHLVAGLLLMKEGNLDEARGEFEFVIQSSKSSPRLKKVAEHQMEKLGDTGEVGEARTHLIKGDELREAGRMEEALQEYEQAAELDPQLVDAYVRAGELLMYDMEHDLLGEALAVFERGLEANPDDVLLHIKAGETLAFMGEWPGAAEHFQRAIDLAPEFAIGHAGLAHCFFRMEDLDGAREEMVTAMRLDPSTPETHLASGLVQVKEGNFDEARREFEFVIQSPKSNPRLIEIAKRELEIMDEGMEKPKE